MRALLKRLQRMGRLIEVAHGPDYRHVQSFYIEHVLPSRQAAAAATTHPARDRTTL